MIFPWERLPALTEPVHAVQSVEDVVKLLQADLAYIVTHTGVKVHSPHVELAMTVNTVRGQIIPRGACTFTDGSTVEFQDIGMPQPGAAEMTLRELLERTWQAAMSIGLELT